MFTVSTTNLDRKAARFCSGLMAASEAVLTDVMGEAVLDVAMATPPGDASVQGESALERGKNAVTGDVFSVVVPVAGATKTESVAAAMGMYRSGGRVRRPPRPIVVSEADFESYLAGAHRSVGYTAGGWSESARKLGKSLPSWMEDVPGPGSITIRRSGGMVSIEVRNQVPWIGSLSGMAETVATAQAKSRETLRARLREAILHQASASGFR